MNYENLVKKVEEFPSLPTVYNEVVNKISDSNSTADDIAKIIQSDVGISTKLLRLVNSPIYNIHNNVTNIKDAIFYVGFNEVKNIVLAQSVMKMSGREEIKDNFNMIEFWKHSIGVGVTARFIAQELEIKRLDDFFVSGVMHDIGKLFFHKVFKPVYNIVIKSSIEKKVEIEVIEKHKLMATHSDVGSLLCNKWNLPESINNVIKWHNIGLIDNEYDEQVAILNLSNTLAQAMQFGVSFDNLIDRPNPIVWEKLKISPKMIRRFEKPLIENYKNATSILN